MFNKFSCWSFVGACLSVALSDSTIEYIDPSAMTYAIQVVASVLVAQDKKEVQDKLSIGENVKKEVEEDVIEIRCEENKN